MRTAAFILLLLPLSVSAVYDFQDQQYRERVRQCKQDIKRNHGEQYCRDQMAPTYSTVTRTIWATVKPWVETATITKTLPLQTHTDVAMPTAETTLESIPIERPAYLNVAEYQGIVDVACAELFRRSAVYSTTTWTRTTTAPENWGRGSTETATTVIETLYAQTTSAEPSEAGGAEDWRDDDDTFTRMLERAYPEVARLLVILRRWMQEEPGDVPSRRYDGRSHGL